MDGKVIDRILQAYGLNARHILPMQKGYRNKSFAVELASGSMANIIVYKSEPGIVQRIRQANTVADFVALQGLPARQTLDQRILQLRPGTYACLYHYLPGTTIPWEAYTMKHLKHLGKTMGDMHAVLQPFAGPLPDITKEYAALQARMQQYFSDQNVARAMRHKLDLRPPAFNAEQMLTQVRSLGNPQALHLDFVRGNILFDSEATITGILDFEKTARGHVLFDIARTLAFLLVDCKYKPEEKVRKYFLLSGYQKRSASALPGHPVLLEDLITFYLIHDLYKFLRHNPYEHLNQNEHFVRTRNLLQAKNILK